MRQWLPIEAEDYLVEILGASSREIRALPVPLLNMGRFLRSTFRTVSSPVQVALPQRKLRLCLETQPAALVPSRVARTPGPELCLRGCLLRKSHFVRRLQ